MESKTHFFQTNQLQSLLNKLHEHGYTCIGPQLRDDVIIFDEISSVEQLPQGINDNQTPGSYSLHSSNTKKYFDWANGPQAIKPLLFTPREELWQSVQLTQGQLSFKTTELSLKPLAVFGVRACDIAAMRIQDQHFLQQEFVDPCYKARRESILTIAVNCAHPAETCFCHSTGDGPFINIKTCDDGVDIVLTELEDGFLINAQTDKGKKVIENLSLQHYSDAHITESRKIAARASSQKKQLAKSDIKTRLFEEANNEAWHTIAAECLSCGNCTSVCPTCFCHSEKDIPELDAHTSSHIREWDSCFTQGHSYIHGITIRSETSQRYRQWLTHKFSSWHEQYGRSGCVGCGRCITWCPVGIDVTESIAKIVERRHD